MLEIETTSCSDFHRHDTPPWLSSTLIRSLSARKPASIVDLGAGGGSLALAAMQRWKKAQMLTVDLDLGAAEELAVNLSHARERHRHVIADALCPNMIDTAGLVAGSVDVVLANPPYRTASWRPGFEAILKRVGLDHQGISANSITPDLIFLAQALYLVRPGGRLGLIVPDTFVTGTRMSGVRATLSRNYSIERVVQLPRGAFRGTDAQAYILVLRAAISSSSILLERVTADGFWANPIRLPISKAESRLDHAFHYSVQNAPNVRLIPLRQLGVSVVRGRASSSQVKASGGAFFHTNCFSSKAGSGVTFPDDVSDAYVSEIIASAGDILLARVDRQLENKVAFVTQGSAPISDCVLRLRCSPEFLQRVLTGLCNELGRAQLNARARGVAARCLTQGDVLDIEV